MARLSHTNFFIFLEAAAASTVVVLNKANQTTQGGVEGRTVRINFYYDGGVGINRADSFNVEWLSVINEAGARRGFFGGEPQPSVSNMTPATPNASRPKFGRDNTLPAGATNINGEPFWAGYFDVTTPPALVETITYNEELQLVIG